MTAAFGMVHVVDDDASWRQSAARLLTAAGYQVALYESALRFLETANVDGPGCILLDVRMPGLTGLQLQERLAEMRHALPIVFVSGYGDIPTSVLAVKAGAEDYLTKPVATDVLLRALERAIVRDKADRAMHEGLDVLRARIGTLTPTERKILALVVRGSSTSKLPANLTRRSARSNGIATTSCKSSRYARSPNWFRLRSSLDWLARAFTRFRIQVSRTIGEVVRRFCRRRVS